MDKSNKAPAKTKRLALKREAVLELKTAIKAGANPPRRDTSSIEGGSY